VRRRRRKIEGGRKGKIKLLPSRALTRREKRKRRREYGRRLMKEGQNLQRTKRGGR
jgi:hypothetical protein